MKANIANKNLNIDCIYCISTYLGIDILGTPLMCNMFPLNKSTVIFHLAI